MTTKKDLPAPQLKQLFLHILSTDEVAGNISFAVLKMRKKGGGAKSISRTWVYNERKTDEWFDQEIKRIQDDSVDLVADEAESNLRAAGINGNTTANIFMLKNLRPDKWRDRQEHTGEGGKPIEFNTPGLDGWLHANIARMTKHAEADKDAR